MKISCISFIFLVQIREILSFTLNRYSGIASPSLSSHLNQASDRNTDSVETASNRLQEELSSLTDSVSTAFRFIASKDLAKDIAAICDEIDEVSVSSDDGLLVQNLKIRSKCLKWSRRTMLAKLMREDYDVYVTTAEFLSPNRIPRSELPNVQDVRVNDVAPAKQLIDKETGLSLVPDCELDNKSFDDSLLDKILLKIFRNLVVKETNGVGVSDKPGIEGLLEQGRKYMLMPGQNAENQHKMVYNVLKSLMTPVLPPFYRIFMSGIVPKLGTDFDGKQIGPWFYAPWLTSFVTPTFFGFLVGPSTPNYRKDGQLGGLVVEKCKFLQESGCKGLCLNQCKLPAQQFFAEELGLPLAVSPNFVTQECQWSFGEDPLLPEDDPSFPRGCLVGCESRKSMAGSYADSF